jgi:hypothetical protein
MDDENVRPMLAAVEVDDGQQVLFVVCESCRRAVASCVASAPDGELFAVCESCLAAVAST